MLTFKLWKPILKSVIDATEVWTRCNIFQKDFSEYWSMKIQY